MRTPFFLPRLTLVRLSLGIVGLILLSACQTEKKPANEILHLNMSGEVTSTSALLQSRLVAADTLVLQDEHDVAGVPGYAYFEVASDASFDKSVSSAVKAVNSETDFILKASFPRLQPNTTYYYRLWRGADELTLSPGKVCTFRTLPGDGSAEPASFVIMSCMHFERFFGLEKSSGGGDGKFTVAPLSDWERANGFPAFRTIKDLQPLFVAATGDNVYYDHLPAVSQEGLRAKWHRQFSLPIVQEVLEQVPFFWEKDDHDYRFNDADTTNEKQSEPSHQLGMATFREQVPVGEPYKTVQVNDYLQVWLVEGRDFRSPNSMPDGPEKSLWGTAQREWLQSTLAMSDAPFKILISPTPLVGPDDAYKRDNHVNTKGFRYERDAFFDWLDENNLTENFIIINGDRHWQYHSIGPYGIHEFGTGALVRQNARYGREPGDPKSTDPEALVQQPFIQMEPTGGFVLVEQAVVQESPSLIVKVLNAQGDLLHRYSFDAVN